jgi:endoribonuclease LACTB2
VASRDHDHTGAIEALYAQARQGAPVPAATGAAQAAAAILWRGEGTAMEVYLVRRAASLAFLGSHWTFPGGRVEPGDGGGDAGERRAAVREVCEELGIDLTGAEPGFVDAARWVTPAFYPIRFDAHYFLVRAPDRAAPDPSVSGGELDAGAWVTPAEALRRWQRAEWLIPSPVLRVLRALVPGPEGLTERALRQAAAEAASVRLWEQAPGIAICPVRTPTLPPATHTNTYVVGTDELVVVDPASPYPEEQAELDRALDALIARGARVVEIWLTHHHGDHVGGAEHLRARLDVPIAAHQATAARLPFPVDRVLADGDTRVLAGDPPRRLQAVYTPGHAPGHLCFLEQETGFLLAGDMVAGIGTILVEPTEGDMRAYLASLERMKSLGPRRLLPAHGMVIADPIDRLDFYIQHRMWREHRVLCALADHGPATPSALVPHAYADVAPAVYPLAERSLIAHLVKLEGDGHAGRDGEAWVAHPVL